MKAEPEVIIEADNTGLVMKKIKEKSIDVCRNIAEMIVDASQQNLVDMDKVVTASLINSVEIVELDDGTVIVRYNAPHAAAVDLGRPAGKMPPVGAIEEWTRDRGIVDKPEQGQREGLSNVAWAIAMKIKKEGFEGCGFFRGAVYEVLYDPNAPKKAVRL